MSSKVPPPSNPLKNRSDFFKNIALPKFEEELLQNYVKLNSEEKDESLDNEDKEETYIVDNNKGSPTPFVLDYPFMRFYDDKTKKFKLVDENFLKDHSLVENILFFLDFL